MTKYIAYYRVSTAKQGAKGNGLEAQSAAVQAWVTNNGGSIIAERTDVQSGSNDDRPKLHEALDLCRKEGAKLIIAKLDRLSRSVKMIFDLRDSGVEFICCDMPEANTLTIGLFAVMAQYELEKIRERTRDGLAARKARLVKEYEKHGLSKCEQAYQEAIDGGCEDDIEAAERKLEEMKTIAAQILLEKEIKKTKDEKVKAALKKVRTPKHYIMTADSIDIKLNVQEITMTHKKHVPSQEVRELAYEASKAIAENDENNVRAIAYIKTMTDARSYNEIARKLNAARFTTRNKKMFRAQQVIRLAQRAGITLQREAACG